MHITQKWDVRYGRKMITELDKVVEKTPKEKREAREGMGRCGVKKMYCDELIKQKNWCCIK